MKNSEILKNASAEEKRNLLFLGVIGPEDIDTKKEEKKDKVFDKELIKLMFGL